jgi:hypothetical protein
MDRERFPHVVVPGFSARDAVQTGNFPSREQKIDSTAYSTVHLIYKE